jgi:methylated-DNA-[protein]-cysteine S-methyltransferase
MERNVYWTRVACEGWNFPIAATDEGLCYVGSTGTSDEELTEWAGKRLPDRLLTEDDGRCQPYVRQLAEYLQGSRTSFTIPMDARGTPFQLEVWEALSRIPYGRTRSYADIATEIGKPRSARAVGAAIGANPILIAIPCHRVIAKNGSLAGYRGGLEMKAKLLQLEARIAR